MDGPPGPLATDQAGVARYGDVGLLALPEEESPSVVICRDGEGWVAEGEVQKAVNDGELIEVSGRLWTLSLPEILEPTREASADALGGLELRFALSGAANDAGRS